MSFTHAYTWREGQIPAIRVRQARRLLHEWKVTSKLRRSGIDYRLVFESPTQKGLLFARQIFETTMALCVVKDDKVFLEAIQHTIRSAEPPLEHLEDR